MMTRLGEHHRRREQHEAVDLRPRIASAARIASVPPRLDPISVAGAASLRGELAAELIEHPRQRQRREVGLVEIRDSAASTPCSRSRSAK